MFCTLLMCGALLGVDPDLAGPSTPAAASDLSAYDTARRRRGAIRTHTFGWPSGVSRTGYGPSG